jgi:hypothetical protein
LLGIAHWQVAQHDLLDEREDRGIGANADRERQQSHGRECRTFCERAQADLQVLQQAVNG